MSRRGRAEAARRVGEALQRAVSCVTLAVLARERSADGSLGSFQFSGRSVLLQGRQALDFDFRCFLDLDNTARSEVPILGYSFQLHDRNDPELIAFHWHPHSPGLPGFPHLHITARAGTASIERGHHVPTDFVAAPAVIRFAIAELGVRPLRVDWEHVLAETQRIVGWDSPA